jgi:hypothetical protein
MPCSTRSLVVSSVRNRSFVVRQVQQTNREMQSGLYKWRPLERTFPYYSELISMYLRSHRSVKYCTVLQEQIAASRLPYSLTKRFWRIIVVLFLICLSNLMSLSSGWFTGEKILFADTVVDAIPPERLGAHHPLL